MPENSIWTLRYMALVEAMTRLREAVKLQHMGRMVMLVSSVAMALTVASGAPAQAANISPAATGTPFRIAGNLYYVGSVGSEDQAPYLIATRDGLILINTNFERSVPVIEKDIQELGFKVSDIKIVLISHAHSDHDSGSSAILKDTGAKYEVMDADVSVVESGGKTDFAYGAKPDRQSPPAHVDRVLHDGDTVQLGGTVLTAHLTAGHTKGNTTWTLDEPEGGRLLHVVIVGSVDFNPGYKLVANSAYPQIADDYKRSFAVLRALPCDVFLGAHGSYFGLVGKYQLWKAGDRDAFIDPSGYRAYISDRERAFEAELKAQTEAE